MLRLLSITLLVLGLNVARSTSAQMVHTSTPLTSSNSSYYESTSIGWSIRGRNWFANFGGGGPLLPPFGGDAGGGLSGGFGFGGGGVSGNLGFNFAQGSSQSISSTSPSLTTMNGYPGSMSSGVVRPFVVGLTPIVSDFPIVDPSRTTATIGQHQLSTLRQSQAVLQNKKLDQYLRRAERAESDGNKRMARANYRLAIGIAPEPLRSQLLLRLQAMMQRSGSRPDRK